MKVKYELDEIDIIDIIAEKYGISANNVEVFGENVMVTIDMTNTEAPEPEKKFTSDADVTDDDIREAIKNGIKVATIARQNNFTDAAKQRLYKRFEQIRTEGASFNQ